MEKMEKIISLCKRRGFISQSSEPYGGFSSCYDYGPLGVELKNNLKQAWWREMVRQREEIVGVDSSILMSPKVWQASGHLTAGFTDPLVECKRCHKRFRRDEIEKTKNQTLNLQGKSSTNSDIKQRCPECQGELTEEKKFNLMMKTFVGPVEDEAAVTYLRAETCQGIYMNYQFAKDSMRLKIPFGIAQIGKAFRNEITPGNFIFRTREFEQMEMQWFCRKEEAEKWLDYWKNERMNWYLNLGIKKENLRFREHRKDELAHYAKKGVDIEYKFPFGWNELEGIHYRGDWDLSNHSKHSGRDLSYFDEKTKERFIPRIIETSAGADRSVLAFLSDAYEEVEKGRTKTTESTKEKEIVLHLYKDLAPVKVAVLPLVKKEPLQNLAKKIFNQLKRFYSVQYDEQGSIGRRYRRQDEIGTPYCLTVDFQSLEDKKLTLRDRETMKQKRIPIKTLWQIIFSY